MNGFIKTDLENMAYVYKYIPLFPVNIITYPCPNHDIGLHTLWQ